MSLKDAPIPADVFVDVCEMLLRRIMVLEALLIAKNITTPDELEEVLKTAQVEELLGSVRARLGIPPKS